MLQVIGSISGSGRITLVDKNAPPDAPTPVDLDLELVRCPFGAVADQWIVLLQVPFRDRRPVDYASWASQCFVFVVVFCLIPWARGPRKVTCMRSSSTLMLLPMQDCRMQTVRCAKGSMPTPAGAGRHAPEDV